MRERERSEVEKKKERERERKESRADGTSPVRVYRAGPWIGHSTVTNYGRWDTIEYCCIEEWSIDLCLNMSIYIYEYN